MLVVPLDIYKTNFISLYKLLQFKINFFYSFFLLLNLFYYSQFKFIIINHYYPRTCALIASTRGGREGFWFKEE